MIQFQGFKPSGMEKIANAMGFQGNVKDFQKFLNDNPDRQAEMLRYQDIAREMAKGGVVKMQEGGTPNKLDATKKGLTEAPAKTISDITSERMTSPALPTGGVTKPAMTRDEAGAYISSDVGNVTGSVRSPTTFAKTEKADEVTQTPIATVEPEKVAPDVKDVVDSLNAAQANPDDKRLEIIAEEQTKSSVSD